MTADANPVAAPVAATQTPAQPSWAEASAAFLGDTAPVAPGAPDPAAQVAVDPWEAELPKPVIRSAAERIAAKVAAQREHAKFAPVEQQLAQERARNAELSQSQARADAEYQRLIAAGDIDGALKVKGVGQSFSELQLQLLRSKSAIPPADPRYDKLQSELEQLRAEKQQATQREAEARARAEQQAQWQQDQAEVQAEVAQLPFAGAAQFAEAPGVSEAVTRTLVANPGWTTKQAAAIVYSDYRALYSSLASTFGAQPALTAESNPGPGVRAAQHTAIPVNGGAAPVLGTPDNLSPDELWQRLVKEHFA